MIMDQTYNNIAIYRKLSRMKDFRRNRKDLLKMLLDLTLEPMKFKIVLLILIYVSTQFSTALILTSYYLISTFSKEALLKHGSFGGIEIFVLINMGTVIFKHRDIMDFIKMFNNIIFPIEKDILGETEYRRVQFIAKIVKVVVLINYGLAIAAAFGFTLAPEYFNTKTYLAVWIRHNFPDYSVYILFVIHLSNFPVAIVLSSLSITMTYAGFNAIFQLKMLNGIVRGICDSEIPRAERYNSDLYQKLVKQKLIISIMFHQLCIGFLDKSKSIIYAPTILFSVGAVILGGSLLLEFFTTDISQMSNELFGIVCFALSGGISASLYVTSGQVLIDESEETYHSLNKLPWYYMNKENRQIYSIFLRRAATPITLSTDFMDINYLLLVRISRGIYSIAALLGNLATVTTTN